MILGGADCTCCDFTSKEHHNLENIQKGIPMNRSIALLHDTWKKLRKNKSGQVITKTGTYVIEIDFTNTFWIQTHFLLGDYAIRKGQTKKPKLVFLDPTKSITVLHYIINMMRYYINVISHLRARYIYLQYY